MTDHPIDEFGREAAKALHDRARARPTPVWVPPTNASGEMARSGGRLLAVAVATAAVIALGSAVVLSAVLPGGAPPLTGQQELLIEDTGDPVPGDDRADADPAPTDADDAAPDESGPGDRGLELGTPVVCEDTIDVEDRADGWLLALDDGLVTGPVTHEGLVYLGSNTGGRCFFALDAATGEVVWTREGAIAGQTLPVVIGDLLVVALDGDVHALDATTGDPVWTFEERPRAGQLTVVDDTVLVVATTRSDTVLHALDLDTGTPRWTREFTEPPWPHEVVVDRERGTVAAVARTVEVIDIADGTVLHDDLDPGPNGWVTGLHGDHLAVLRPQNNIGAVDLATGERWERNVPGSRNTPNHATSDGGIVFGADDGNAHAMDLATAVFRWSTPINGTPSPAHHYDGEVTVVDTTLYLGTTGGVTAVDIRDGELVWELDGAPATTVVHAGDDGQLHVTLGRELVHIDPQTGAATVLGAVANPSRELATTDTTVHVRSGSNRLRTLER